METTTDKVREARLRRMARRQGLEVRRSRRRDRRALDYGLYSVLRGEEVLASGLTIDQLEARLTTN